MVARSFATGPPSPPAKRQGMLTVDQLSEKVKNGEIETVVMGFPDITGRPLGKRYDAEFFLEEGVKGSHACEYLFTVDVEQTIWRGFKFANWQTGYGDMHLIPDFSSLRVATWLPKTAWVVCDIHDRHTHTDATIVPRSILKKQIQRANSLGFIAKAASEVEYYMYKNTYEDAAKRGYAGLTPQGWYLGDYLLLQDTRAEGLNADVRRHLKTSGVPVENSKGEYGHGQHELNVKYDDALTMADNHVIYKQCFKEIAEQKQMSVTFMAKPHSDQSGSSCHIHMSLWDAATNTNAFAGDKDFCGIKCSDTFRHFLAGWLKYTPDMMAFYAPTINSYKRFQSASWAPTRLAWSPDNRTAGFRIVGSGKSLRIECRIPGADANPYLAFAASLAAGLEGLETKLEPPAAVLGDVYNDARIATVPRTLYESVHNLEHSEMAKKALGQDVVDHYSHYFKEEVRSFNAAVTDWERKRYFEHV